MSNHSTSSREATSDDDFEFRLLQSLRVEGFIFPYSDDEVEAFYIKNKSTFKPLPADLKNPDTILTSVHKKQEKLWTPEINTEILENLAQAARHGSEISTEILKRMEEDRQRAENQKK